MRFPQLVKSDFPDSRDGGLIVSSLFNNYMWKSASWICADYSQQLIELMYVAVVLLHCSCYIHVQTAAGRILTHTPEVRWVRNTAYVKYITLRCIGIILISGL